MKPDYFLALRPRRHPDGRLLLHHRPQFAWFREDGARNHRSWWNPAIATSRCSLWARRRHDRRRCHQFGPSLPTIAPGNGSWASAFPWPSQRAAITYLGERAAATVSAATRSWSRDAANGDTRVDLTYIAYPLAQACGDWSENRSFTMDNTTPKDSAARCSRISPPWSPIPRFGSRPMGPVDTARRATVMEHYAKGEVTQAAKHSSESGSEQSAGASSVGQ